MNTKPKLSILTVNYNTSDFIELILYALDKLTKNTYQVFIVDNNSTIKDYKKLLKYSEKYNNIYIERNNTQLKGSKAHGTALDYLIQKIDTEYFSILDSDATWLKKDWDDILIKNINAKTKVIGTQAPGIKHKDFPLMFCILFESKTFNELHISFKPKEPYDPIKDTGWEIREKYLNAQYKGEILEFKNTRTYKKGPFKELLVGEYYQKNNYNNIFASHFGRGASMGANKYKKGKIRYIYKIPIIGKMLLKHKGQQEKLKWINICKTIIDNQTQI